LQCAAARYRHDHARIAGHQQLEEGGELVRADLNATLAKRKG
jgi:hypothetical protein